MFFFQFYCPLLAHQALATTRVTLSPVVGGPNDIMALSSMTKDRRFSGQGSDTDIITSSARAYVSALNKLLSWTMRRRAAIDTQVNGQMGNAIPGPAPAPTIV
jgi:2-isopropylmalate synthase